ncbi:MAG: glycosyltransferase family 4 protein [Verrucomicrobiales bacterium]|nr:glycosyltransferase family 4 protein [Verrucomicrobiales bacterium]
MSPKVILVSPQSHYPFHYWSNTAALLRELRRHGVSARAVVFTSDADLMLPEQCAEVLAVFKRLPRWWRKFVLGRVQGRRLASLLFHLETLACLWLAVRVASHSGAEVLHWIGGTHLPVFGAVLLTRRVRFVYSLFGRLTAEDSGSGGSRRRLRSLVEWLVCRAVRTGRLEFVCETELIRQNAARIAGAHAHVIPYAIDTSKPLPDKEVARARLDLPAGERIFLFFGTHRLEKDYRTALRGCLMLPDPPLALFVGKVISANDPRAVVAECGYPKARVVDEFVPDEVAELYFAAADVVVLPYEKNFSRGSGVLIESCRYQRPILVSAAPYLSEFIGRYRCGETFEPGDPKSFAEAARRVLSDLAAYEPGLTRARQDHSWDTVVQQYLALYRGWAVTPQ